MEVIYTSPEQVRVMFNSKFSLDKVNECITRFPFSPGQNRVYLFEDYKLYTWQVNKTHEEVYIGMYTLYKVKNTNMDNISFDRRLKEYHGN